MSFRDTVKGIKTEMRLLGLNLSNFRYMNDPLNNNYLRDGGETDEWDLVVYHNFELQLDEHFYFEITSDRLIVLTGLDPILEIGIIDLNKLIAEEEA